MTPTLAKIGLVELAVAALLGWALIVRHERPELLTRIGVRSPRRILQCHLDQIMMGLILIALGLALPGLPTWIAAAVVFGAIMNPLLFLPQAFSDTIDSRPAYKAISFLSVLATSGGLTAAAIWAL